MRIYVRREYGTDGPYSLKQLQELVNDGAVTFNDSAWIEGTADWVPLNQIKGIYVQPAPEPGSGPLEDGPQVRPWIRYWARLIDTLLISIVVAFPIGFIQPKELQNRFAGYLIVFLALVVWIPIEAVLLATLGCTPGKALLKVSVTNKNGSKLSVGHALSRSFRVWWKGLGTGLIPLVTLITYAVSYKHLSEMGVTDWDRKGQIKVTHRKVGTINAFTTVAILAVVVVVVALRFRL